MPGRRPSKPPKLPKIRSRCHLSFADRVEKLYEETVEADALDPIMSQKADFLLSLASSDDEDSLEIMAEPVDVLGPQHKDTSPLFFVSIVICFAVMHLHVSSDFRLFTKAIELSQTQINLIA